MKIRDLIGIVLALLITGTAYSQTMVYPSEDGPGSELVNSGITAYEGTALKSALKSATVNSVTCPITTEDNDDNAGTGVSDFDLDVYLFNTDGRSPIEFNIIVENTTVSSAQLSLLAYDVDWISGERDEVYFNGHLLGYLTGANAQWSTTVFNIDPTWVVPGPSGVNTVQIDVDVNGVGNWAVTIDWGQLSIDGGCDALGGGTAEFRTVSLSSAEYRPCELVPVTIEPDADPDLNVRIETNILDPDGHIVAGASRYVTATSGEEVFIENLTIPCSSVGGEYQVVTIMYDASTYIQLDIEYLPFTVIYCPPDMVVDNSPGMCGAYVYYNTPPGVLVDGFESGAEFPLGTTNVVYADPACSFTVTVVDTEEPEFTCKDATIELDELGSASITLGDVVNSAAYIVDQTGVFNPVPGTGTEVSLSDDEVSEALPIGFDFEFYDNAYSEFYISSNGFITFSSGQSSGCCSGQYLPNPSSPNNLIAFAWADLYPPLGYVDYFTTGIAPNRMLVVNFIVVPHFIGPEVVTAQAVLYESSNVIEIHTTVMESNGRAHTMGLENIDGTLATVVPGRNASDWSVTNDFVAFIPDNSGIPLITDNCGVQTAELSKTSFNCDDVGENTVTVTVTDINGNISTCTPTVTVVDNTVPVVLCQDADIYLEKNGTVTIEPEDIDNGSSDNCGVLSVEPNLIDCAEFGEVESVDVPVTLTMTDPGGNEASCDAIVTVHRRPTSVDYTGDLTAQYSDEVNLSAVLMDETPGEEGPLEGMTVTFEIGDQSVVSDVTDENGVATATLTLDQSTCDLEDWTVKTTFAGACSYWKSEDEDVFDYQPELAAREYTGIAITATEKTGSESFTATLRGIIMDEDDVSAGDVSNARARFVAPGLDCPWLDVQLLNENDPSIGMIEFVWEGEISGDVETFDIGIELEGCYYLNENEFSAPLTVYDAAGDFITGGGHMIMTEAADGFYPPTPDSKLNFGFNLKWNKKGTNLQGKMNAIYRELDESGDLLYKYQIKSNATQSLGTNLADEEALIAEFVSKAELYKFDEYDNELFVVGNLTLHVTMTDRGEPGSEDAIAFSLYNGDPSDPNALWFSSNWDVTKTIEQVIDGGNLVVHSGVAISVGEDDEPVVNPKDKTKSGSILADNSFNAYPNPFADRLYFEFSSDNESSATLELYDVTGRKIAVLFEQDVQAKRVYKVEFVPENLATNILIYRMKFDDEIINGRVIYKK